MPCDIDVLRKMNKFLLLAVVDKYSDEVKSKFEDIKNRFQKEKETKRSIDEV
jgi:hypothetical protein